MTRTTVLLLAASGIAACAREPVKRSNEPVGTASAVAPVVVADVRDVDASMPAMEPESSDAAPPPRVAVEIDDATLCRLRRGCDGGPGCAEYAQCASCFKAAAADRKNERSAREACRELYLVNGCQDRCVGLSQAGYDACERKCRTVYRDPSTWPPAK